MSTEQTRREQLLEALRGYRVPRSGPRFHKVAPRTAPPPRPFLVIAPCPTCDPYIPSRLPAGLAPEAD